MCSRLYARDFRFGKRIALGVQGAKPFAHALSKAMHKCALACSRTLLFFQDSSFPRIIEIHAAVRLDGDTFFA